MKDYGGVLEKRSFVQKQRLRRLRRYRRTHLTIEVTPYTRIYLQDLLATGLYGPSLPAVVVTCLSRQLEALIDSGMLKRFLRGKRRG